MDRRVAEKRLAASLTQVQLAALVGVSRQTTISIERGKFSPSVLLAIKIARELNTSVEVLFTPGNWDLPATQSSP
jgi:putative transcriptional regulator